MKDDISTLIAETIQSIKNGLPENFEITDDIRFEIQIVTSKSSTGGMDIKLLNAESEQANSFSHKISFEVSPSINKKEKLDETLNNLQSIAFGIVNSIKLVSSAIEENNKLPTNQVPS